MPTVANEQKHYRRFTMAGAKSLLEAPDLGIINGRLTTGLDLADALSFQGLFAPPFASSDFRCELRLAGEKVPLHDYTWHPIETRRRGRLNGLAVTSTLILAAGRRAGLLSVTVRNPGATRQAVPVQIAVTGGLERTLVWEFGRAAGTKETVDTAAGDTLIKANDDGCIVLATDLPTPVWHGCSRHWEGELAVPGRGETAFTLVIAIGEPAAARADAAALLADPAGAMTVARREFAARVAELDAKLPTLRAADRRLEKWYDRSLLHLLLNRWDVPEFKLHPFFATGGINGGCVGAYLWDFGELWEIFNLYEPAALRDHVRAFLAIDLTRHYALSPLTGEGFGPWYYINQEKIIFLVYYYVLHSGDTAFLAEDVNGRTILDHVTAQALVGDDLSQPAVLADYGNGNHHLELRRQYRYDHYLPDMNGRRYACYLAADTLCTLAGRPPPADFKARAAALKTLLRKELWSSADNWFHWLDAGRNRHLRHTVQMFKLIGSPVLDPDMEAGLLGHLNDREFLSAYGLHSMAKPDPAYDQVDIDNGGGGCCTCFPPQIIEKLYRAGHPEHAEAILRRLLWWGERLPYWGDSMVANAMDYRRDTPLQNAIGAAAAAQAVIFGLFGVQVRPDGAIIVNPVPPSFSPTLSLKCLRIRGRVLDIRAGRGQYRITCGKQHWTAAIGHPTTLPPAPATPP